MKVSLFLFLIFLSKMMAEKTLHLFFLNDKKLFLETEITSLN